MKTVKLAWIENERARKSRFKKRKSCLLKKMSELTTLCGINGFVLVYSQDTGELTVWPSGEKVEQLLAKLRNMPEHDRRKKMANQETYLLAKIAKTRKQLRKAEEYKFGLKMDVLMHHIQEGKPLREFGTHELIGLVSFLDAKMMEIWTWTEGLERDPNLPRRHGFDGDEGIGVMQVDIGGSISGNGDGGKGESDDMVY